MALIAVFLLGAGSAWALTGGIPLGGGQPSVAESPSGSTEAPASIGSASVDSASSKRASSKTSSGKSAGDTFSNGTVTLTDVKVTKIDTSTIPSEFMATGERGWANKLSSLSGDNPTLYGECLYKISAHAVNESDDSAKGWLKFDSTAVWQDDYGDDATADYTFETNAYTSTEKYADVGAFYLAPNEERDVEMLATWRGEDPGVSDWNPEAGNGVSFPTSFIDSGIGGGPYKAVVLKDAKPVDVETSVFGSKYAVVSFDDFGLKVANDGKASVCQVGNASVSRKVLGGEITLTNTTDRRINQITVGVRFGYDGLLTPFNSYFTASKVSPGEEVDMRSGDDDGSSGVGPTYQDASKATLEPWYIIVEYE